MGIKNGEINVSKNLFILMQAPIDYFILNTAYYQARRQPFLKQENSSFEILYSKRALHYQEGNTHVKPQNVRNRDLKAGLFFC
jgi:shikimate kinase